MATEKSSAPAHPSRPEVAAGDPFIAAGRHDDTVETHYSGLERLGCAACYRGVVYLTYEEDGHEWAEPVPCRRCAQSR